MATLTDAGPLIALIDRGEEKHSACVEVLPTLSTPLVTTWPCFTEAMYLSWRLRALEIPAGGTTSMPMCSASTPQPKR